MINPSINMNIVSFNVCNAEELADRLYKEKNLLAKIFINPLNKLLKILPKRFLRLKSPLLHLIIAFI